MKRVYVLMMLLMMVVFAQDARAQDTLAEQCIECHEPSTPGIVKLWRDSKHAAEGTTCVDCHQPREGDPSARWHFGSNITPVPSPQYCMDCHPKEVEENS